MPTPAPLPAGSPVHNVSQPVIGRDFEFFELEPASTGPSIH
jgi:hypothetical protein